MHYFKNNSAIAGPSGCIPVTWPLTVNQEHSPKTASILAIEIRWENIIESFSYMS
jgi:hypothetical protein